MSIKNLLIAATLRVKPVTVLGETVHIKEPTYAQMAEFREATGSGKTRDATASIFMACVVDADGNPALTTDTAYALVDGSMRVLNPLMAAITDSLKEDAKNV